ncbi:cysteine hydrolase family protein [Desulfospira joergensenii]|uniref:cysteine hydrolase family protein n=1 Tax=Desulfospira joergensenii TaxID=53329 RepID=UPI0003B45A43|nr:cysteine hydrolase [Desulfospira joergensenii]
MDKYIEPDFISSAVITIDTQKDTLDGQPLEIPGTSLALPKIKMILDAYRQKELPIIHIVRIYKKDGSNVELCRKKGVENGAEILLQGTPGCEPAPEMFNNRIALEPELLLAGGVQNVGPNEVIIYKPRWGAFYNTPLHPYLKGHGINTLVFTGCNYPNCPRASIYEASERDFKIVLVEDALSGLYSRGKQEMENIGVRITKAEKVRDAVLHGK